MTHPSDLTDAELSDAIEALTYQLCGVSHVMNPRLRGLLPVIQRGLLELEALRDSASLGSATERA